MLIQSTVRDFFILLKPRVMTLVVFTGIVGLLLAPGEIHPFIGFLSIFCIALGSGAAGAINMWYERDLDALMKRTKSRPLPMKKIHETEALHFGVAMAFFSIFIMSFAVNYFAAFLLLCAILFYVFIYTIWLKRRTPQNIVIGGAAGAFPPLIGWASVTNSISLEPILLFLIIFIWTPPHFWALSLYKSDDYKNAGIPMLPVVAGTKNTKIQIFIYTILLFITTLLPYYFCNFSLFYFLSAIILGIIFLYLSICLFYDKTYKTAKITFGFSIIYLFLLFSSMLV